MKDDRYLFDGFDFTDDDYIHGILRFIPFQRVRANEITKTIDVSRETISTLSDSLSYDSFFFSENNDIILRRK